MNSDKTLLRGHDHRAKQSANMDSVLKKGVLSSSY